MTIEKLIDQVYDLLAAVYAKGFEDGKKAQCNPGIAKRGAK